MEFKDYYKILQVDPSAEPEIISAAYRRLALKYHPDTNKESDTNSRMQEINEAYDILSNTEKKAEYDQARLYQSSWFEQEERRKKQEAEAEERRRQAKTQAESRTSENERQQAGARRYRAEPEKSRTAKAEFGFTILSGFFILYGLAAFGLAIPGIILGILALWAGGLFVAQKESRKSFGLMTLSGFLILYGLSAFGLAIPGIILGLVAPLAGGLFVAQKESRKSFGLMTLSSFLILFGLSAFGLAIPGIILGLLALGVAVFTLIGR